MNNLDRQKISHTCFVKAALANLMGYHLSLFKMVSAMAKKVKKRQQSFLFGREKKGMLGELARCIQNKNRRDVGIGKNYKKKLGPLKQMVLGIW